MRLAHFVITRFSYRGSAAFKNIEGPTFHRPQDPLDPKRLELRFKLFELTCLPSIIGQADQSFVWIILIDSALPAKQYERLHSLVKKRQDTVIHVYDPGGSLGSLDWLRRYSVDAADYVATTNLDDDDALPAEFVGTIRKRLFDLNARNALPPIGIVGAKQIIEWDLIPSDIAPLGWRASWHRGSLVASVGLSLYCKVPEFNFCVLGIRHRSADRYLDFSKPAVNANALWFQRAVLSAAQACNMDARSWGAENLFHDISEELGAVLMTNHTGNDQVGRLLEQKPDRSIVTGARDFPGLLIDWEKARVYAPSFGAP